jgi:hypothetical protein
MGAGVEPRSRATDKQFGVVRVAKPGESAVGAVIASNDPRLQALGAHAATHKATGIDPIRLDELKAPTDNTLLDATTARHGLFSKLDKQKLDGLSALGVVLLASNALPAPGDGANGNWWFHRPTFTFFEKTAGTWNELGVLAKRVEDDAAYFETPTAGEGKAALTTL